MTSIVHKDSDYDADVVELVSAIHREAFRSAPICERVHATLCDRRKGLCNAATARRPVRARVPTTLWRAGAYPVLYDAQRRLAQRSRTSCISSARSQTPGDAPFDAV